MEVLAILEGAASAPGSDVEADRRTGKAARVGGGADVGSPGRHQRPASPQKRAPAPAVDTPGGSGGGRAAGAQGASPPSPGGGRGGATTASAAETGATAAAADADAAGPATSSDDRAGSAAPGGGERETPASGSEEGGGGDSGGGATAAAAGAALGAASLPANMQLPPAAADVERVAAILAKYRARLKALVAAKAR